MLIPARRYIKNTSIIILSINAALGIAPNTWGAPTVSDPNVNLTLYDEGGALDRINNGGHVGAIEVAADGSVFVVVDTPHLGALTTTVQLVKTTGLGTSQLVGAPQPVRLMPWASDLTLGPGGLLYVAGAMDEVGGVFGLDPEGVLAPQPFATASCGFSTSGLTFAADGSHALVSTDGEDTSCSNGLYRIWPDGTTEHLIELLALPAGIPRATDDHAVMLDGRIIMAGDKSHELWNVTDGAGSVIRETDLDYVFTIHDIPGWQFADRVFGGRLVVDPVTGDLFYSHGVGSPDNVMTIIRISADFSAASIFAEGFSILRDFAFGPVGSNNERSLYVVELRRESETPSDVDTGAVYEIAFPVDVDADGVPDSIDNCVQATNADQRDTNGDGFGNICDPDLNNDGIVNFADIALWAPFFSSASSGDEDFNGDGVVNFIDYALFPDFFLNPPGPSSASP